MEALKQTFGFTDGPLIDKYFTYLKHLFKGDLGISTAYFPEKVSSIILSGLGWTLLLVSTSLIISFIIGTLIGIFIAWRRDGKLDSILPPTFSFISSFPYFFTAMLLLYFLGFQMGWFPIRHAYNSDLIPGFNIPFIKSCIHHAILPASTLIFMGIGGWMLQMRNNMMSTISTDYFFAKSRVYLKKES